MNNNTHSEFLLVRDLTIPKQYISLVGKLIRIYGENLSVADLKKIAPEEFSQKDGIKTANVDRFKKFKKILDSSMMKVPVNIVNVKREVASAENVALGTKWASNEWVWVAYPASENGFNVCGRYVRQSDLEERKEERSDLSFKRGLVLKEMVVPVETILDAETIEKAKEYKISFYYLSKDERTIFKKYRIAGVSYDEMTPLYILSINVPGVSSARNVGKIRVRILRNMQIRIIRELNQPNPSGFLIPKTFGESFSLPEIEQSLLEDLQSFCKIELKGNLLSMWKKRVGYKNEAFTLQAIGDEVNRTRENVRQQVNIAKNFMFQGVRVSPETIRKKIAEMSREDILKQIKGLRSFFYSDAEIIRFVAEAAQINPKKFK